MYMYICIYIFRDDPTSSSHAEVQRTRQKSLVVVRISPF